MRDQALLNKIVVEIAKLGFIATFDDRAIVISKKNGSYVQPQFVWTPKVKNADYLVVSTSFGKEIKEMVDNFFKMDPDLKQNYLNKFIEDNDLVVSETLCLYVSDPSSNNECIMLNMTGDNLCDENGEPIDLFEQYKSPEIREIICTCMSRVMTEAGERTKLSSNNIPQDMWQ